MSTTPQDVLNDCAETHESKDEDYGSSWLAIGEILFNLSDGEEVVLSSPSDFVSLGLFTRRFDKIARAFHGEFVSDEMAHESLFDSHADEATYAAMHASTFSDERPEPQGGFLTTEEVELIATGQSESVETSIGFVAESSSDEEASDDGFSPSYVEGETEVDPRYEAKYQELTEE